MNNRYLFSIIFVVFIDLLGFSLIIPLLPYYAQTFNASDFTVGLQGRLGRCCCLSTSPMF
jgi:DHA1 family tetracycline resistance protein-like MFS transporter